MRARSDAIILGAGLCVIAVASVVAVLVAYPGRTAAAVPLAGLAALATAGVVERDARLLGDRRVSDRVAVALVLAFAVLWAGKGVLIGAVIGGDAALPFVALDGAVGGLGAALLVGRSRRPDRADRTDPR